MSLYTNEDDIHETSDSPEREISLSTASVLGIFFALALVCAIFFGFGYTMGRRSSIPVVAATTVPSPAAPTANNSPKPSPNGILAALPSSSSSQAMDTRSRTPETSGSVHSTSAKPTAMPVHPTPAPAPPAAQLPTAPATSPTGTFIVQVAAVSHHEDADVLIASLKQRGYDVSLRQVPQDKLLHVQLGPFATRKDAETMRQRLLANGYNAIVK